ncbi:MAG TPA: DedA family protein [Syntrophorhabdales bacterium]|nr:DedA family protein [Syntrophorhabdales bacterium]
MHYGYIGVAIGTFFEGEVTVLLGGIFSKLEFLSLNRVILYACTGTFLGDCTFFFLGRLFGRTLIDRYQIMRSRTYFADRVIHRYGNLILFTMRFLAGFRTVILLLLGCTHMNIARFLVIDFLMAALWAGLLSLLGYSFGNVVYIFVTDVTRYQRLVVPMVVAGAIAVILLYRRFVKRKEEERRYGS